MSEAMLCVSRIRQHYPLFSSTERRIADFILQDPKRVLSLSTAKLAEQSAVSPATIIRFCRAVGFRGLSEFKHYLGREQLSPDIAWREVALDDSLSVIAQKDCKYSKAAIDDTFSVLEIEALARAVDVMLATPRIVIFGEGGSGSTARCAFDVLLQIDMPCTLVEDPFFQIQTAHSLKPGDVVFTVCHSGAARNVTESVRMAKQRGATVVAIVGTVGSPVAKAADIPLYTGLTSHPFFSDTITARICELSVLSTLHAALVIRRSDTIGNYREKVSELLRLKRVRK